MNHFMPSFLLCNLLISGIIGALLVGKRLLRNSLSSRMQYNLWFLLLGLLAVPFLPVQKINLALQKAPAVPAEPAASVTAALQPANAAVWINELGVTVSSKTPSFPTRRSSDLQNPFWHRFFVVASMAVWHRGHGCLACAVCPFFSQNQTVCTPAAKSCGSQAVL